MLDEAIRRQLSEVALQALSACVGERIFVRGGEKRTDQSVYFTRVELPYAFDAPFEPLFAEVPVVSQRGDLGETFELLFNEGLVAFEVKEAPREVSLSLTLLGALALTQALHDDEYMEEEAALLVSGLPRFEVEMDHEVLYAGPIGRRAVIGSSLHYPFDHSWKFVAGIVAEPDGQAPKDLEVARALLESSRRHFDATERLTDYEEDELERYNQLLLTTALLLRRPEDPALLVVRDSESAAVAWFLMDRGEAERVTESLLVSRLDGGRRDHDELRPGALLLETYDADRDPGVALSEQPAEPFHVRWVPSWNDSLVWLARSSGLTEGDVSAVEVEDAAIVQPPKGLIAAIREGREGAVPDPLGPLGPTSMFFVPSRVPLAGALEQMVTPAGVDASSLTCLLTRDAIYFSFRWGERTLITRPVSLHPFANLFPHQHMKNAARDG